MVRVRRIRPLLISFAKAARISAAESRVTAARLREIPADWRAGLGPLRGGSAITKLLDLLPAQPILSSEDARIALQASSSSVFAAVSRLQEAGILRPLTDRKRDQVWGAGAVLDEVDDLGVRIAQASR